MVISRIIAPVHDPVKPCCFDSQMNIYLDDFQLSKIVFILERFYPNKLFKSAVKACLILVPRSDLAISVGLIVLKYRIFCPFSPKKQGEGSNSLSKVLRRWHIFLEFALFTLIKTQVLSLEGMMSV